MINISFAQIRKQLYDDLVGKDSYRGVTLTYAWLANQFGHFALGFIPAIMLHAYFNKYTVLSNPTIVAASLWAIICLVLEILNFIGPLLLKRKTNIRWIYIPNQTKYTFQPPWKNVAFDTLTDILYFWLGCFSASEFLLHSAVNVWIITILLVMLFFCFRYWYFLKMYLQSAHFPFQFRLSQWDYKMSDIDKTLVHKLILQEENFHLLLCGNNQCGRTSLAVGIATEISMQKKPAHYTTAMKLLPQFYLERKNHFDKRNELWEWTDASLLVIDDINPSNPVFDQIICAKYFFDHVDTEKDNNEHNRYMLKNKKVIWVLGVGEDGNHFADDWKKALQEVGIEEKNIHVINLSAYN